jgi:uncharacterized membrane protein YdjX (TVP38/TMEM64 family)
LAIAIKRWNNDPFGQSFSRVNDDPNHDSPKATRCPDPGAGRKWIKPAALTAVALVAVAAYWQWGGGLSLERLAARESSLRALQADHPIPVLGGAFLVYVAVTGLSVPGAAAMTLVLGWLLGFWPALAVVSFASTAGATLAFLFSRYLFRDAIQRRFGPRLDAFNRAVRREGAFYLFTLRLVPVVPFFAINLAMGLTPLRVGTFWWVSQLGMLPGTAVFVYAGSAVPSLNALAERGAAGILTPKVLAAFVLLGLFPIAVKKIMARWRGRSAVPV